MTSPIAALTWEMWQRGRRTGAFAIGLLVLSAVTVAIAPNHNWARENLFGVFIFVMVWSFILLFAVFHYAEHNARNGWHGFPYRLFVLPVPTWLLTSLPMLTGFFAVELFFFAWAKCVFEPLGNSIPYWPGIVLGVGIVSYQSMVWCLAGFRVTRILSLAMAGLLFVSLGMTPIFAEAFSRDAHQSTLFAEAILMTAALAAFFGAWMGVERQRRGGGRGRGWLLAWIRRFFDAIPRRTKRFDSPSAAQFWYEWRTTRWMLPAITVLTLVTLVAPISYGTRNEENATLWCLGWTLALPIILGMLLGKAFSLPDSGSRDLSVPAFLAIRPITSGEIVVIKIKVSALSVLITWLLVLGYLMVWIPLWAKTSDLHGLWEYYVATRGVAGATVILLLVFVMLAVLTWRGLVGDLWVGLSGNKKLYFTSVFVGAIGAGAFVWAAFYLVKHFRASDLERFVSGLGWALAVAVMLKLWLAVVTWSRITPKRVWQYALAWSGFTTGGILLSLLIAPNVFWIKHLLIMAALLPIPLARLGFAPSALAKNRHR